MYKFSLLLLIIVLPHFMLGQERDSLDFFDIPLEDLLDMEVTTASKKGQKLSEAPAVIDVITSRDIILHNYQSVGEALNALPGVFVTTDHVNQNVSFRGINSGRNGQSQTIKVMIDGQSVAFRPTAGNFLGEELIPMTLIDRIEVIRGPASTLYGANAFLGVVNIITKKAEEKSHFNYTYSFGNIAENKHEVSGYFSRNKFSMVYGFKSAKMDRSGLTLPFSTNELRLNLLSNLTKDPYQNETTNDLEKPFSLFLNMKQETKGGSFYVQGSFQEQNSAGRFIENNPINNETQIAVRNGNVRAGYKLLAADSLLTVNLYTNFSRGEYKNNYLFDLSEDPDRGYQVRPELSYNSWDFAGEIGYALANKKINVLVGADQSIDKYNLMSYTKYDKDTRHSLDEVRAEGEDDFKNLGVYGQLIGYFLEKGTFAAGIRYDDHYIYGEELNYRLVTSYSVTENFYFKLLYGTSFRAPTPTQLFSPSVPYTPYGGLVGNEKLSPEKIKTYEISLGYLHAEHFSIQLNGYYNDASEIITIKESASTLKPRNQNTITTMGGELSVKASLDPILLSANVSYQQSEVDAYFEEDRYLYMFPELMVKGMFEYRGEHFSTAISGKYIGDFYASQNNINSNLVYGKSTRYKLGDYAVFDFNISSENLLPYFLPEHSTSSAIYLSASVKNVLDQFYLYPGFNKYDVPTLGRQFLLSLKFSI